MKIALNVSIFNRVLSSVQEFVIAENILSTDAVVPGKYKMYLTNLAISLHILA